MSDISRLAKAAETLGCYTKTSTEVRNNGNKHRHNASSREAQSNNTPGHSQFGLQGIPYGVRTKLPPSERENSPGFTGPARGKVKAYLQMEAWLRGKCIAWQTLLWYPPAGIRC